MRFEATPENWHEVMDAVKAQADLHPDEPVTLALAPGVYETTEPMPPRPNIRLEGS